MRTFRFSIIVILAMTMMGCKNKRAQNDIPVEAPSETVADTTIYGKCGDETAMHTLELITDNGDTLRYMLETQDTCSNVQGGLFVGDRLAVIAEKIPGDEPFAKKVINLTSLLGKWTSLDRNFEICEGGAVNSSIKEPRPYTEWKILNGQLILSADTFDVYSLGSDSLYLENKNGIYGYKRVKK